MLPPDTATDRAPVTPAAASLPAATSRLPWRLGRAARPSRRRRRLGIGFWLAAAWIALVVLAAATADLLPLHGVDATFVGPPDSGPSWSHPLGTDGLGRDLLSRVVYGARVSLGIGIGALAICFAVGGPLGLLAGYHRGKPEAVIMAVSDIALAFPALILALAVVAMAGASFLNVLLVLGALGVPAWTRVVRGATLTYAEREFVVAARALGARSRDVIWREIVPNVLLPVASFAFIAMAVVVVAEGSLAFLGLSVPPPTPSWRGMINEGRYDLGTDPHLTLAPVAAMFLTVLAFNLVGDRLRELGDVRESGLGVPRRRRVERPAPAPVEDAAGATHTGGGPRLLEVVDLRTAFRTERGHVRAVDGVSLTLERDRTVGVVGESGSGKTMLVRSVLGLLPSQNTDRSGRVVFDGQDLSGRDADELRDVLGTQMGAVFQDPMTALNPVRTIGTQLAEPLQVHRGMSKRDALARARELLVAVQVPEPDRRLRQYPHQLSGGMRQRVTIALALSCDPVLLFADEPTTALDVTVQDQILRLLHAQRQERHMAMLLISHDLAVVAQWADEVIVMYAGKVVERGPTEALFTRTRMPYTEALLQAIPDPADPSHTRLRVVEGRPPDLADLPTGCRFHPRCPYAQERCMTEEPPLIAADDPGHAYACWFPVGTDAGRAALAENMRRGRPQTREIQPREIVAGDDRGR
ncbi:dipeptide/oligopeptide/nickel ABC transporter permease/ATP-binding protein [Pseudonocardia nigra]|uniref:dipeptide/oligopeptide/nickel ABC transporter permease/ATP-binding protein n=1 Tax=Pseudonocardia nigra TaxID=1921578 RepID=UPI0027E2AE58|nr:dipeptide/oligopeptide/nickel ABC transporter permease/ATP-binding protein [Pseudonocardia nigra]